MGSRRRDRGAALPEYALAVAAIAVVLVAGVDRLEAGASNEITTRAAAGAPDLAEVTTAATFDPGTSTTAAPAVTTTTSATSATQSLASSASAKGSKWTMTVTVALTDPSGQPLVGATVTTSWSPGGNGTTSCTTTGPSGACNVTQDQMRIADTPSATMTVISVVGPNGSLSGSGSSITSTAP
jgi:Flp pilus assembly pilin Flp